MAATPQVKFEDSPAESFISTPGAEFPSLFGTSADPETVMTPQSIVDVDDSLMSDAIKTEPTSTDDDDAAALGTPAPDGEKKSAKKRKSWGQVLPEPKTNLPPRKRAKTEDEKEQRRVERVLRNRRAAQSSRERKRQEAENLEKRAQASEKRCEELESMVRALMDELNRTRSEGSSRNPLPTLSQSLFRSTQTDTSFLDNSSNATVDPASLSPAMTPEPDVDALVSSAPAAPSTPTPAATTSTDETQHSAVSDGRSAAVVDGAAAAATTTGSNGADVSAPAAFDCFFSDDIVIPESFAFDPLCTQIQLSPSSHPYNIEGDSAVGDASSGIPDLPQFDLSEFLYDFNGGAASGPTTGHGSLLQEPEPIFGLFEPENQNSSENLNQQPHPGASSLGCDDGGIAVGSI